MDLRLAKLLIQLANLTPAKARDDPRGLYSRRYSVGRLCRSSPWVVVIRSAVLSGCAASPLIDTVALAQDANYTSVQATPDKPVQLSYHASAHKENCSAAPIPSVRVLEPPKAGFLKIRRAMLTTNEVAGCRGLNTHAEVIFYVARTGYAEPDHVKYEVTDDKRQIADYDATITVKAAEPSQAPPTPGQGTRPL